MAGAIEGDNGLKTQFDEEITAGRMITKTAENLPKEYPPERTRVASLNAIKKEDSAAPTEHLI